MNRKVKRYDPINSDGTCGMCIEDADYGAYVEYADYAALEAELARLRAGQEPVASISWTNDDPEWKLKMLAEPVHPPVVPLKLYTTPQPSAVPDGWKLVPVERDATIAELQEELDAAREILAQQGRRNTELRAELAKLRAELDQGEEVGRG